MSDFDNPANVDEPSSSRARSWPNYAAVWRWHFYAGVFCIPFVIVLSITGTIYLFRPQIEAWQERDYDRLPRRKLQHQALSQQVRAAVASVAAGKFVAVERPAAANAADPWDSATRVIVDQHGKSVRVYLDPVDGVALDQVVEEERLIAVVKRIHGELLLGKRGSYLVELAASWTIVMVVTGLVLWMPRKFRLAGVLYPRLTHRGKTFWKDMHSVGGFWASGLIVFLIASGLPWSTFWGDYFKSARRLTGTSNQVQHWSGGHDSGSHDEAHADHATHVPEKDAAKVVPRPSWRKAVVDPSSYDLSQLDRVASFAESLDFLPPVVLSPPTENDSIWTIKSETANRPHQQTIRFDAQSQQVVGHETFSDRHWVDRMVGQGIALHEGQRFGLLNQLIALIATGGLLMLSSTGLVLWWRRGKSSGAKGLKPPAVMASAADGVSRARQLGLAAVGLTLAIYLPLFGISLLAVLILDALLFSRCGPLAVWLGRTAKVAAPQACADG